MISSRRSSLSSSGTCPSIVSAGVPSSGESANIGRTYGDAPKVDGYMFVQTGELLVTGDFEKVKVTGAMEYDLIGELADEYTE